MGRNSAACTRDLNVQRKNASNWNTDSSSELEAETALGYYELHWLLDHQIEKSSLYLAG